MGLVHQAGRSVGYFLILIASVCVRRSAGAALVRPELSGEAAHASDVSLLQAGVRSGFLLSGWDLDASVAHTSIAIDYRPAPFDLLGALAKRDEEGAAIQVSGRRWINEGWQLRGGGGVRKGFTNYREVWLDEYFRQHFAGVPSAPGGDTYADPDPYGWSLDAGLRWAHTPGSGFAQLTFAWLRDRIAPGYEIDFDGLRMGREYLDTPALGLSFENVLSPRVRSLVEVRGSRTSGREWRLSLQGGVAVALGEHFVFRGQAGLVDERPEFSAWHVEAAVEWEIRTGLSLMVNARAYSDTGEIENALLFTSAAPALDSTQIGAGLRWQGETWNCRLTAAPIRTRYAATNLNTDFFQNLYRDRDWMLVRVALGRAY